MSDHTHTPLHKYRQSLTTAGHKIKLVNEVIDGLKNSTMIIDCPACNSPNPKEGNQ